MPAHESQTVDGPEIYDEVLAAGTIFTGDLFYPISALGNEDCAGVVLTPICDLAHEKIEWVKLARAHQFQSFLEETFLPTQLKGMLEYRELSKEKLKSLATAFVRDPNSRDARTTLRLISVLQRVFENVNPLKASHYYLPGKDDRTQGYVVDFSCVFSARFDQLMSRRPLLRLGSPWREQLLNRYIGHSLRIGTLDYSKTCICETFRAIFPELTTEQIINKMK